MGTFMQGELLLLCETVGHCMVSCVGGNYSGAIQYVNFGFLFPPFFKNIDQVTITLTSLNACNIHGHSELGTYKVASAKFSY